MENLVRQKTEAQWEPVEWQSYLPAPLIGVDEVGRGCLAGPVCAAAAVLNPQKDLSYLNDSKLLSPKKRAEFSARILEEHQIGLGWASVEEIDEINIFQASFLAMQRAIEALSHRSGHVLVDGKFPIKGLLGFRQTTFIKGDLRVAPISAASIVAKVARDELMVKEAEVYKEYGFEKHKGYSTQIHKEAIARWGPCIHHRRSFSGVKEYC